jgi:hypothetical protein
LDGHYTKGEKSTTTTIEKALHTASKAVSTVEINKSLEERLRARKHWVFSEPYALHHLVKTTLNDNMEAWDYILVFSQNGWHLIPNNRVVAIPIKRIQELAPRSSPGQPPVASMPINNTI